jgi:hypothetical protein
MLLCDFNPLALELSFQCDVQETGIEVRAAKKKSHYMVIICT